MLLENVRLLVAGVDREGRNGPVEYPVEQPPGLADLIVGVLVNGVVFTLTKKWERNYR